VKESLLATEKKEGNIIQRDRSFHLHVKERGNTTDPQRAEEEEEVLGSRNQEGRRGVLEKVVTLREGEKKGKEDLIICRGTDIGEGNSPGGAKKGGGGKAVARRMEMQVVHVEGGKRKPRP